MKYAILMAMFLATVVAYATGMGPEMILAVGAAAAAPEKALDELSQEIKRIIGEFNEKSTEMSDAIAKSEQELKDHGEVTSETKGLIEDLSKKFVESEGQFEARLHALEQEASEPGKGEGKGMTLGDYVIESKAVKDFAEKQGIKLDESNQDIKLRHRGASDNIEFEFKDITSAANSAGDGIWSYRDPELVSDPYRPRMVRELIPTVPVGSNLVEWVQTNVRTNNAAPVSETGTKPKSDLTYDLKQTAVRKIAHYFKTSAEVLADFPRLRGEINTEGFEMLRQEEEDQLMSGDGTGINLLGLIPSATDFDIDLVESGDTQLDVLRRAILQVRQSFYGATGIVLNPADWAAIELLKDSEERYLFASVNNGAQSRLWGLPVAESDAVPEGEFMVGAFRTAATIYDRMMATVYISTENEDDFITNMVSILFEERLALAVKRPLAFVHGALTGSSI